MPRPRPRQHSRSPRPHTPAPTSRTSSGEIIDFDSEAPEGREFLAFSTATGMSRFTEIPWPTGLAPETGPGRSGGGPLPRADVLLATWTVDEGHALSRVLTPGKDSRNDYRAYTHNYAAISAEDASRLPGPAGEATGGVLDDQDRQQKGRRVQVDSHLSQDTKTVPGPNGTLPNYDVWKQIIEEVRPKLVITTGTAGGIGKAFEVGDVVVSPIVRFDCLKWLKKAPFHDAIFKGVTANAKYFATAKKLFKANSGQLPPDNTRQPKIVRCAGAESSV